MRDNALRAPPAAPGRTARTRPRHSRRPQQLLLLLLLLQRLRPRPRLQQLTNTDRNNLAALPCHPPKPGKEAGDQRSPGRESSSRLPADRGRPLPPRACAAAPPPPLRPYPGVTALRPAGTDACGRFRGRNAEAAAGGRWWQWRRAEGRAAPGLERLPATGPRGAAGPPRHERRRGVPHPPQLPLEPAAGQRQAGAGRAGKVRAAELPAWGRGGRQGAWQCAGRTQPFLPGAKAGGRGHGSTACGGGEVCGCGEKGEMGAVCGFLWGEWGMRRVCLGEWGCAIPLWERGHVPAGRVGYEGGVGCGYEE